MTTTDTTHTIPVTERMVMRRRFGWHYLFMALSGDFEAAKRQATSGAGGCSAGDEGGWYATCAKGIYHTHGSFSDLKDPSVTMVTWTRVRRILESFQPDRVAFYLRTYKAYQEHSRKCPIFKASKLAQGCGPLPADEKDYTDKHRAYLEESERFEREQRRPWQETHRVLSDLLREAEDGLWQDGLLFSQSETAEPLT